MSWYPFRCILRTSAVTFLACVVVAIPCSEAATWTWQAGSGLWSETGNWAEGTVPASGADTVLVFGSGGGSSYTATHDVATPLVLNRLVLQSGTTSSHVLNGAVGAALRFSNTPGGAMPAVVQNGSSDFEIALRLEGDDPLRFEGTGTGVTHLSGVIASEGGLEFAGGHWQISNSGNTFRGGFLVRAGSILEVLPQSGITSLSRMGASSLVGGPGAANQLNVNGGTLKISTNGPTSPTGGHIFFGGITLFFGPEGGVLDLTNSNPGAPAEHAGTIGARNGNMVQTGGTAILNLQNTTTAVVRFNGGQLGYSSLNVNTPWVWDVNQNVFRFRAEGSGPLRVELSNGAMARAGIGSATINAPTTFRGVPAGDPTSGPDGLQNTSTTSNVGRIMSHAADLQYANGLVLEDSLQVASQDGASRLSGGITLAGIASSHLAYVTFSGRATEQALHSGLLSPGSGGSGQNVLYLGAAGTTALTVEDGAIGVFDVRVRVDQASHSGALLDGSAVLEPGGTLRIAQSISNYSQMDGMHVSANVGDVILRGPIEGKGSTAKEAVLDLRLPAPSNTGSIANGVPTPLTSTLLNGGGVRPFGGLDAQASHQIIINGSGFGGLRVEANARPDSLFSASGAVGGATIPDPTPNSTKLQGYLTAQRLAGLTGNGGYLTGAPNGETWAFPAGGEWADGVPVGLKIANHHPGGVDVTLANLSSFRHNLLVDPGATLDLGTSPFIFGPASASPGTGVLRGTGTVIARGGLTVAAGGQVVPGMSSIGTLTIQKMTLEGGLEIEADSNGADLLSVVSDLVLSGSSHLTVPVSSVLGPRNYRVVVAETRTGVFGATFGLPTTHSLSYSRPGEVWLSYTGARDVVWTGSVNGQWDTSTPNWAGPTAFANTDEVIFDDSAPIGRRTVTVTGADVAPTSIRVNTSGTYTLASSPGAAIVGTGELIKTGSGTLILAGPASFEGGILIQEGTVQTAASDSIPDAGKVVVSAGGRLDLGGLETIKELIVQGTVTSALPVDVEKLALNGAAAFQAPLVLLGELIKTGVASSLGETVDLAGGARKFRVEANGAPANDLVVSGKITNGGVIKSGTGTLVLNEANEFSGGLIVEDGVVRAGKANAIPVASDATVGPTGTLDLNGHAHNLGLLDVEGTVLTGGADVIVEGLNGTAGTIDLGAGALQINQTVRTIYAGNILGTGAVSKSGPGSASLSGANTFNGLDVSGGVVRIQGNAAAGTGPVTVAAGGTIVFEASVNVPIVLAGGTLGARFPGQDPVSIGEITAAAGTTSTIILADSEDLPTGSDVVFTGTLRGSGDLHLQASFTNVSADKGPGVRLRGTQPSDFTGTITLGSAAKLELQTSVVEPFSPMGTGKIVMTAGTTTGSREGSYSQLHLRNNTGGDVVFGNDVEITGTGVVNFAPVSSGEVAPAGSTIRLGNLSIGLGQIAAVNKNTAPANTVEFASVTLTGGAATFAPSSGIGFTASADLALGPIAENALGSGIVMTGTANLFLRSANAYTGTTRIDAGTIWLGAEGSLPPAAQLEVNGGVVDFQNGEGTSFNQSVAALTGFGNGRITNSGNDGTRNFVVDQAVDTEFTGSIEGNLDLIKEGVGALGLRGTHTHTGFTNVAEGTLILGTPALPATIAGTVVVESGGTLTGNGSVGPLNVAGVLAPGHGTGEFVTGNLVMQPNATVAFELDGTVPGNEYDRLLVFGSVLLQGPVELELRLGFDPIDHVDAFTLVLNDATDPVGGGGRFTHGGLLLEEGARFAVASDAFSQLFEIHYSGGDGNDVVLLAVPEPGAAALLMGGMLVLARRRRV